MRLIDAGALQKEHMKCNDGKRLMLVDVAPTVDAVEVVRCENCRYFVTNYAVPHCGRTLIGMKKFDFCSYGERKEEWQED